MYKLIFGSLIIAFVLVGCSTVQTVKIDNSGKEYAPTNVDKVLVYCTADAGRDYIAIAEIVVMSDAGENSTSVVDKIKEKAADYGADAIVGLRFDFGNGFWATGLKGTATAVKFK